MKNKLKKSLFGIIFAIGINANAGACLTNPGSLMQIVASTCYECMFPITIAGMPLIHGPMSDPSPSVKKPICVCDDPFPRVGIPISFFEPSRLIEVVSDPFCFPSFGFSSAISVGVLSGNRQKSGTSSKRTFMQTHYGIFPIMTALEIITDFLCLEVNGIDYGYITEVDPLWNSDELTAFIQPEALLFGNPITNLACIADSISASAGRPIDLLFWCMGTWGNAYPLTGSQPSKDSHMGDIAAIASKMIYKLHRQLMLFGSYGTQGLCGQYPMPIWRKSVYRIQPVLPVPTGEAIVIGEAGIKWDMFKDIPMTFNNYSMLLFKKRDCCVW